MIYLFGGFLVFAFGAIVMILAYKYGELSVLQPINSSSYVFSTIIGIVILQEKIHYINIIGIFLILLGVVVIGFNK